MPNLHKELVLKLYVIGLSIDLTYLEKVKYGVDSNRDEFLIVHKRLYLVLIVLGYIIEDLPLRRLCVEAASVCEFTTNNSISIFEQLPLTCSNNVKCSADKLKIYNDLRSLLGNFKSAIKINKKLIEFYDRSSVKSYENLEYLNNTRVINTELKSIIYPGIERGTKNNPKAQENVHNDPPPPPPDFHRVRQDNENFLKDISQRFKLLYDPFETLQESNLLISPRVSLFEIKQVFINQLNNCIDFHIKPNDLFFVMSSITVEQIMNYHHHLNDQITLLMHQNAETLYFDFNDKKSDVHYEPTKCDLAAAYNEGVINVWNLSYDTNNIFDIENIMFYAINLKKVHCTLLEFPQINRNCSIPKSLQLRNTFLYMVFRGYPGYSRVAGFKTIINCAFSFLDVLNELFDFDIEKFKSSRKKNVITESQEIQDLSAIECSNINESVTETSMEINITQEKLEVKKKAPNSNRKEAQSNVIDSTTTYIQNLEIVKPNLIIPVKKVPTPRSHIVRSKLLPTFDCTDDIEKLLLLLENELSMTTNTKVVLEMLKKPILPIMIKGDKNYLKHSQITITMVKNRGSIKDGRTTVLKEDKPFNLRLPIKINGSVNILINVVDSIVYSNILRDDPKIDTKMDIEIFGQLSIDHLTTLFIINVQGINIHDCSLILSGKESSRKHKSKLVKNEPVIVQEEAPTKCDENRILLEIKKECENNGGMIESNNEMTMNYTFDQYEQQNTVFIEQIVEEPLNDVEMPLSVDHDLIFNQGLEHLEPMNFYKDELTQQATPSQEIVKEFDLKFDVFTDIKQPDLCTILINQSRVTMPTNSHTMETEFNPEPALHEPLFCYENFEHNDDHNKSKSPELVNLETASISPQQNIPQHIINCEMNVPLIFENEYDVKPDFAKLNDYCIDLTDDNDKNLPNFSFENRALRTYSKSNVGKTLLEQQSTVKCVSEAIDFESMMPSVQLVIPEDFLNAEAERARWRCEMTKHDEFKVLPVKGSHRPGPACHSKSKRKSGESNARPLLHSVNRNSNVKNTKKCSVLLFNCLQDIHLGDLRSNMDIRKNKVNVQLPASVSLITILVCCFN